MISGTMQDKIMSINFKKTGMSCIPTATHNHTEKLEDNMYNSALRSTMESYNNITSIFSGPQLNRTKIGNLWLTYMVFTLATGSFLL